MKKLIVIFGASGYVATTFMKKHAGEYDFLPVFGPNSLKDHDTLVDPPLSVDMSLDNIGTQMDVIVERLRTMNRPVGGIVFLQGINPSIGIQDIEYSHFMKMSAVNLFGPIVAVRALAPHCIDGASVSFVSSVGVMKGSYDPAYCCSKTAISGLVKCINNNFASLRANIVVPGLIEGSPVHMGMTPDYVAKHMNSMNGSLIRVDDVCEILCSFIRNEGMRETAISLHRGMRG